MEEDWGEDATRRAKAALISTLVPNAKRVADYMYGGQNNFEADRKAARSLAAAAPIVAAIAPAVRGFQQRALRYLVVEAGIRQFLDIGTDLPLVGSTHDVAQSLVPECRIAYVDNDPMVLSHARALMKSAPGGVVGYVDADVREPGAIVAGAKDTLDFGQPVAIMLLFTLAYVLDGIEAAEVVSALVASLPSGSYVAIYHLASDLDPTMDEAARIWNKMMPTQAITLRSQAEVASLVAGLDPGSARPGPRHRVARRRRPAPRPARGRARLRDRGPQALGLAPALSGFRSSTSSPNDGPGRSSVRVLAGDQVHQEEVVLAVGAEHEGRVVGLLGAPDDVVVEAERRDVERDRGVDVIDGDLDLGRPGSGRKRWHGDSLLDKAVGVANLGGQQVSLAFQATPVAGQDMVRRRPGGVIADTADVLDR